MFVDHLHRWEQPDQDCRYQKKSVVPIHLVDVDDDNRRDRVNCVDECILWKCEDGLIDKLDRSGWFDWNVDRMDELRWCLCICVYVDWWWGKLKVSVTWWRRWGYDTLWIDTYDRIWGRIGLDKDKVKVRGGWVGITKDMWCVRNSLLFVGYLVACLLQVCNHYECHPWLKDYPNPCWC